jgi:CHASE1-domain containing sensor protein
MVSERFIRLSVSNAGLVTSPLLLTRVTSVLTLALPETTLSIAKSPAHRAHSEKPILILACLLLLIVSVCISMSTKMLQLETILSEIA